VDPQAAEAARPIVSAGLTPSSNTAARVCRHRTSARIAVSFSSSDCPAAISGPGPVVELQELSHSKGKAAATINRRIDLLRFCEQERQALFGKALQVQRLKRLMSTSITQKPTGQPRLGNPQHYSDGILYFQIMVVRHMSTSKLLIYIYALIMFATCQQNMEKLKRHAY
jgi:hypothetical protein